jgi:cytochrome bd-type quinol oxidase subunit 2
MPSVTEWDETKSLIGRRSAAVLVAIEALYIIALLAGLANETDSETGESLAPVAAALLIVVAPIVIAFGATAWMLWRGRVLPANGSQTRTVRNLFAMGVVVLINGALAAQGLVGILTIRLETERALAGFVGLIVATACVLLVRAEWRERIWSRGV